MAGGQLRWRRIATLTGACCFGVAAFGFAQFTSLSDRSRSLLEGNWQSCRETDGHYAERVYDGKWPGMGPFELHMGPYHEFALFRGIQEAHRDHNSAENLLKPFNIELRGRSAQQTWDTAGLRLHVTLAGGSREECESWYVTLQRSSAASH
jgi:YD repeat-containing protein